MVLAAVTTRDGEGGRAACHPETGATPQGDSSDEVMWMLLEAIEMYLEEFQMAPQCPSVMNGFEIALSEMPRCRHFEDADKKAPRFHERPF